MPRPAASGDMAAWSRLVRWFGHVVLAVGQPVGNRLLPTCSGALLPSILIDWVSTTKALDGTHHLPLCCRIEMVASMSMLWPL